MPAQQEPPPKSEPPSAATPQPDASITPDASQVEPDPQPSAALSDVAVAPDPSECTFVELRARGDQEGAPFHVPGGDHDALECFMFDLGFDAPTQALAMYPVVENPQVIHHWLLYAVDSVDSDRISYDCTNVHPIARTIGGWAPGMGNWYLPKHVGFDLGKGRFVLEVHYFNQATAVDDRSGVRICTTRTPRPETASVSWLGGDQLFTIPPHATNYSVAGRCAPRRPRTPIHVLRSWPHMHRLGTRMTMRLDRSDGSSENVFDLSYAFSAQHQVDTPLILASGDSLLTTCYYDNPGDRAVSYGDQTTDEMCFNFVVAYPAGALASDWLDATSSNCVEIP
jgi:hypothetical protein